MVVVGSKPCIGMGIGSCGGTSFPPQHQRTPEMEGEEICNVPFKNILSIRTWQDSFLEVKRAYRFDDASVLVMPYFPLGTLLVSICYT